MSACQRPWRAFTCWLSLAFTVGVSLFFCNPRFLSEPAKGDFENKPISREPAEEEHPLISRGIAKKSTASFQHVHTSFSNFGPQKNMIDRQHTRDQRLLTALIGFRLADPNQRLHQWRSVRETGSTGPHVPARGAWCTRGALKSSSAFPRPSGKRPVGALSRLTTQQSLSGTSCADSPDRRVTHPWYRAVREGHLLGQAHPG